jgi:hypothetical protein
MRYRPSPWVGVVPDQSIGASLQSYAHLSHEPTFQLRPVAPGRRVHRQVRPLAGHPRGAPGWRRLGGGQRPGGGHATPKLSRTAGRYDLGLLLKALKALGNEDDAVVLSAWQGGPLRLQRRDVSAVILLMPQEAQPLPAVPAWLEDFAAQAGALREVRA